MASVRDAQRFRKIYSYYKQRPREEVMGAGVSETVINGLDWKHSARVATTGNITISPAPAVIDGITLSPDDRVLVKDQSVGSENGIYFFDVGLGDLVRTPDASDPALTSAAAVFIEEGLTHAACSFVLVTPDPISVGTTSLQWVKFAGAGGSSEINLHFLSGKLASSAPSGSMESVGMDYLSTSSLPPTRTPTYTFTAILATTLGTTAYMDLYDYDGIFSSPGPISGSVLTGSSQSYTYLTADVTAAMSSPTGNGIIEARIWCDPTGSNLSAICKSAKLTIS